MSWPGVTGTVPNASFHGPYTAVQTFFYSLLPPCFLLVISFGFACGHVSPLVQLLCLSSRRLLFLLRSRQSLREIAYWCCGQVISQQKTPSVSNTQYRSLLLLFSSPKLFRHKRMLSDNSAANFGVSWSRDTSKVLAESCIFSTIRRFQLKMATAAAQTQRNVSTPVPYFTTV